MLPCRAGCTAKHPLSQEMASDELKEIRKAMTKEAIREHQMARTGGTQTDLFTCSKCRKKNCTYTQVCGHLLRTPVPSEPAPTLAPLILTPDLVV